MRIIIMRNTQLHNDNRRTNRLLLEAYEAGVGSAAPL